jgi:hypothetical protein
MEKRPTRMCDSARSRRGATSMAVCAIDDGNGHRELPTGTTSHSVKLLPQHSPDKAQRLQRSRLLALAKKHWGCTHEDPLPGLTPGYRPPTGWLNAVRRCFGNCVALPRAIVRGTSPKTEGLGVKGGAPRFPAAHRGIKTSPSQSRRLKCAHELRVAHKRPGTEICRSRASLSRPSRGDRFDKALTRLLPAATG